MGVETQRYIRKPLYVDAVRITSQNFKEIAAWCEGKIQTGEVPPDSGKRKTYIKVNVIKPMNVRQTMAFVGDWLLRQNGNFKIYTHKAFKMAFDPEEEKPELISEHNAREAKAQEKKDDDLPPQPRRVGANIDIRDDRPKEESHKTGVQPLSEVEHGAASGADAEFEGVTPPPVTDEAAGETIEADDGTVEGATPQGLADAIRQSEQIREVEDSPEETIEVGDSPTAPPVEEDEDRPIAEETPVAPPPTPAITPPEPVANTEDKRVLSEHEQRILGPDAVREMVRSGEVILSQDLERESA